MSLVKRSLADLIYIHDHLRIPLSGVEREKRQGEFPYYGAQSVIDYIDAYIFDGEYVLVAEDGENLRSRKQPIAQIVSGKFWVNNHAHILTAVDGVSTNAFLSALINWIDISPYVTGAAQPKLSQGSLKSIKVKVPNYETQRQISEVLGGYDELIETNRRRIALLEESARLLYREWFVNLRFPAHEQTKVIDGVPAGWCMLSLGEVAEINRASLNSKSQPSEIQYIDIASVETGIILGATRMLFAGAPGRARRLVQHGDVIWSCVRPNRRSYALMWKPDDDIVVSTGFSVLTAKRVPFSYLYFATTSDDFVAYLTNRATGAAYPAVTSKDFEEAPLLCPKLEVMQDFHERCLPILELRDTLITQNGQLTIARDELLPKLMSGAIQV